MAIIVRTCCCGCDLRTGILLIGIFGLVSVFHQFVSSRMHVRKSYARRQMAWLHTAMQLCHIQHIFKVAFLKRFLMHLFLRKLILYTLSLAFSDLSHDIAFKN